MPDGSVEVLACGPSDALERLGAWLRSGPPMASVENVETTDVESRNPGKFTIG
jgi:acylphosphatase